MLMMESHLIVFRTALSPILPEEGSRKLMGVMITGIDDGDEKDDEVRKMRGRLSVSTIKASKAERTKEKETDFRT
jgi:hypothetical protein